MALSSTSEAVWAACSFRADPLALLIGGRTCVSFRTGPKLESWRLIDVCEEDDAASVQSENLSMRTQLKRLQAQVPARQWLSPGQHCGRGRGLENTVAPVGLARFWVHGCNLLLWREPVLRFLALAYSRGNGSC